MKLLSSARDGIDAVINYVLLNKSKIAGVLWTPKNCEGDPN
jgi:hypothetical protein